jgi:pilus assembly protein Flp/PilA
MFNLVTHLVVKTQSVLNSRIAREETGATAVEYGLIVGLIAVVIIAAVALLGTQLQSFFTNITGVLAGHVPAGG